MEVNSASTSDFQNRVLSILFSQNRCLFALLDDTLKVILMCFYEISKSWISLIYWLILNSETGILLTSLKKYNWLSCRKTLHFRNINIEINKIDTGKVKIWSPRIWIVSKVAYWRINSTWIDVSIIIFLVQNWAFSKVDHLP